MKTINKKDNGFYNNKTNQVDKSSYYNKLYSTPIVKESKLKKNKKQDDSTPSKND